MKQDNSWLKLYRRIGEHEVLFDNTALRLFIWLLTHCDKSTGEIKVSKHWTSQALRLRESTFYHALKRLEKKHKIISLSPTKKYTSVRLLNWAKYQSNEPSNKQELTKVETTVDTIQEERIKNIHPSDVLEGQPQDSPKEVEKQKNLSPNQLRMKRVIDFYQSSRQTNIANYGKSLKAVSLMFKAGYTPEQIEWTIKQMVQDEYYFDKTWDLMTVADKIPTYKAKAKRRTYGVQQT